MNDRSGLDVFVRFRPANLGFGLNFGAYHGWLELRPNNPADFIGDPYFTDMKGFHDSATISGDLVGGKLNSRPNYDRGRRFYKWSKIQTPCGLSDTQFIKLLERLDSGYVNNFFAYGGPTQNSNSFVHGLLDAAGVNVSPFWDQFGAWQAPYGWSDPLPVTDFPILAPRGGPQP